MSDWHVWIHRSHCWSEIREVLNSPLEPEELAIVQKTLDRIAEAFVKAAAKAESDMWRAADETSTVGWALLPVQIETGKSARLTNH